jgi:hypothetical protein
MRRSFVALVFVVSAVMPLAASGGDVQGALAATTTAPEAASSNQATDLDTVVCKKLEPPTGTRLGGRTICQTNRHWQELQRRSQEETTKIQDRGNFTGPGPGN